MKKVIEVSCDSGAYETEQREIIAVIPTVDCNHSLGVINTKERIIVVNEERQPKVDTRYGRFHNNSSGVDGLDPTHCCQCHKLCHTFVRCSSFEAHNFCRKCIISLEDVYAYCEPLRCPLCQNCFGLTLFQNMPERCTPEELEMVNDLKQVYENMRTHHSNEIWDISELNFIKICFNLLIFSSDDNDDMIQCFLPLCMEPYLDDIKAHDPHKYDMFYKMLKRACRNILHRMLFKPPRDVDPYRGYPPNYACESIMMHAVSDRCENPDFFELLDIFLPRAVIANLSKITPSYLNEEEDGEIQNEIDSVEGAINLIIDVIDVDTMYFMFDLTRVGDDYIYQNDRDELHSYTAFRHMAKSTDTLPLHPDLWFI